MTVLQIFFWPGLILKEVFTFIPISFLQPYIPLISLLLGLIITNVLFLLLLKYLFTVRQKWQNKEH